IIKDKVHRMVLMLMILVFIGNMHLVLVWAKLTKILIRSNFFSIKTCFNNVLLIQSGLRSYAIKAVEEFYGQDFSFVQHLQCCEVGYTALKPRSSNRGKASVAPTEPPTPAQATTHTQLRQELQLLFR
ncbi:MAG: hypothetical protein C0593_07830, partial [Marinilabiliales bacterium]